MNQQLHASEREIHSLLMRREMEKAEKKINRRLEQSPNNPNALYLKGVHSYLSGKITPAIDDLKKCLSLEPHHTDAAICLSVLLNDIGRYDEAKNIFNVANTSLFEETSQQDLGVNKKFSIKHLELADLYFRYRRYDEATEEYTKASLLDPKSHEIRLRRAKAFAKKGMTARAIQDLNQIISEQPLFLQARIQLGLLQYTQGNMLDAELEWEAVLQKDPENSEALAYLEMARQKRKT